MQNITPSRTFVEILYSRADTYFKTQQNGQYATPFGLAKSCLFVLCYVGAYSFLLFDSHLFSTLLGWAALLGMFHVIIPVNIAHDAIHGTLSSNEWINRLGLFTMEMTGANAYIYRRKHLEAHHNKEEGNKKNSIETQGLLLQKETNEKTVNLPYFFYLFYAEYMIFVRDFQLFQSDNSSIPKKEKRKLYVTKFFYALAFLVLPFFIIELPAWQILCALFLMYFVITVLLVIILLMPTEKMEHSRLSADNNYSDKWAMEILAHNVDFSPASRLLNNIVGGANLNVVHYLFPNVNHVHYNNLAKLVEETAQECSLLYRKQNVKDVLGIHFNYLKRIQEQPAGLVTDSPKI